MRLTSLLITTLAFAISLARGQCDNGTTTDSGGVGTRTNTDWKVVLTSGQSGTAGKSELESTFLNLFGQNALDSMGNWGYPTTGTVQFEVRYSTVSCKSGSGPDRARDALFCASGSASWCTDRFSVPIPSDPRFISPSAARATLKISSAQQTFRGLGEVGAALGTLFIIIIVVVLLIVIGVIACIICCCCCTAKAVADSSAPPQQVVVQQQGGYVPMQPVMQAAPAPTQPGQQVYAQPVGPNEDDNIL